MCAVAVILWCGVPCGTNVYFLAWVPSSPGAALSNSVDRACVRCGVDVSVLQFTPFDPVPNQLVVTHATRTDIMALIVRNHRQARANGKALEGGLIITGATSLPQNIVAALDECESPCVAVSAIVRRCC